MVSKRRDNCDERIHLKDSTIIFVKGDNLYRLKVASLVVETFQNWQLLLKERICFQVNIEDLCSLIWVCLFIDIFFGLDKMGYRVNIFLIFP